MTARGNAAKQLSPKNDYFCGVTSAQTLQIVFTLEKIMSFKDNTDKLQIKLTPVAGQPTAADGSTIYEVERIGSGNGTPLNAKTLNDEFAKKQDKLTTVYDGGIAIDNNNISISPDIMNLIKNGQYRKRRYFRYRRKSSRLHEHRSSNKHTKRILRQIRGLENNRIRSARH